MSKKRRYDYRTLSDEEIKTLKHARWKRCPFCGDKVEVFENYPYSKVFQDAWLRCLGCDISVGPYSKRIALKARWNMRVDDD